MGLCLDFAEEEPRSSKMGSEGCLSHSQQQSVETHQEVYTLLIAPTHGHKDSSTSNESHASRKNIKFVKGYDTLTTRMHKDNLFNSPGRGDHISPHSIPKNARTDPFYSPDHSPEHESPYASVLFSPDEMMQTANHEIKFENVDWAARNREAKQSKKDKTDKKRSLTPTKDKDFEHVETISLTPPMAQAPAPSQPKPTYYSPPRLNLQSPPQYQGAPAGGLNIQYPDEKKEMVSSNPTCDMSTTNDIQNEKGSWEPTHPPPSHYVPYKEFEDVELNKPRGHTLSQRQRTDKHYEPPAYYKDASGRSWPGWVWVVFILLFLICFVGIPLGIFGGVYHWNYGEYRCNRSWGKWDQASKTCRY